MKLIQKIINFKGSHFLIPMFLTSAIYTFFPDLLTIGEPFSGFFRQEATFFIIAVLLLVSGIMTDLKKYPKVITSIGPILLLKISISLVVSLLWKIFLPTSSVLGISLVTMTSVLLSCNPGMYMVLLGEDISEMEESAFSVINLLMLPAIPLFILSIGESSVDLWRPLIANILPFAIGILIGYIFPSSRGMFRPLSMLLIPFLAVTFGAKINLIMAVKSSLSGLLLAILFYLISVLPVAFFDRYWNKNQGRMTIAFSSIAAFSMSIPPFVSQYLAISEEEIAISISQIAFAVIISSFATPIIYNSFISKNEQDVLVDHIYYVTNQSSKPEFLIDAMTDMEWGAGKYLANRLLTGDLDDKDLIIFLTTETDRVKGFVALVKEDIAENIPYSGPYLSTLYVAPDYRGLGLSLKLIDLIEEAAQEKGYQELFTLTQHQGLYEKHHFVQIDMVSDKFGRDMRLLHKTYSD